jgi:hypothetical protein
MSLNTKQNLNSVFIILVQVTHFWVGFGGGGMGDKSGMFSPTNPIVCFRVGDSQSYQSSYMWELRTAGLCLTSGSKDLLINRYEDPPYRRTEKNRKEYNRIKY